MRYPRFALVAVLARVSVPTAWSQPQAELVLHFVEIGQGDFTLIECPNGGFILVDAGSTARGDRDAVRDYVHERNMARQLQRLVRWHLLVSKRDE